MSGAEPRWISTRSPPDLGSPCQGRRRRRAAAASVLGHPLDPKRREGQLSSQFHRPPKPLAATVSVSLHKLTHAAYYVLPGVPRLFKFAQFGDRWIYVRRPLPDR